jgi:hypothetical protein
MRRLVAALLFLFPEAFRRRFGPDMLATFDSRWQEQPSWRSATRIVFDLAFPLRNNNSAAALAPLNAGKETIS